MMSEKEAYVREWLDKAEHDLISARLLEIEPMVLDNVCFHCQQAVEKYLKAFLAYYSCTIEKTHNVVFLLAECSDIDAVFATVDPLNINAYAIQGRYPGASVSPTSEEASGFYKLALQVKELVVERIVFG